MTRSYLLIVKMVLSFRAIFDYILTTMDACECLCMCVAHTIHNKLCLTPKILCTFGKQNRKSKHYIYMTKHQQKNLFDATTKKQVDND